MADSWWYVLGCVGTILGVGALIAFRAGRDRVRGLFAALRGYTFSEGLRESFLQKYPKLNRKKLQAVEWALKEFWGAHTLTGHRPLVLPSKIVAAYWALLIETEHDYTLTSLRTIGQVLPWQAPAIVPSNYQFTADWLETWMAAQRMENRPHNHHQPPLLFVIDKMVGVEDCYWFFPPTKASQGISKSGRAVSSFVLTSRLPRLSFLTWTLGVGFAKPRSKATAKRPATKKARRDAWLTDLENQVEQAVLDQTSSAVGEALGQAQDNPSMPEVNFDASPDIDVSFDFDISIDF